MWIFIILLLLIAFIAIRKQRTSYYYKIYDKNGFEEPFDGNYYGAKSYVKWKLKMDQKHGELTSYSIKKTNIKRPYL